MSSKNSKVITTLVKELLDHPISEASESVKKVATDLGVDHSMPIKYLFAMRLISKALSGSGDLKTIQELLDRIEGKVPNDSNININNIYSLVDQVGNIINNNITDEATKEKIMESLEMIDINNGEK